VTTPYDPTAGAGSSTAGQPLSIWGLTEDQAKAPVFAGTVSAPFGSLPAGQQRQLAGEEGLRPPEQGYGPQFVTATQAMEQLPKLWNADRAGYVALQQKLYAGGFYGQTSPQSVGVGAYNEQTVAAYRRAVLAAVQHAGSQTPVTFDEILDQNAKTGRIGQKPPPPGFVAEYSDPQTVAALAQRAAQTAWGRNMPTAQVAQFVAEYHRAEQAWNAEQKAAAQAAAGGTDVAATARPSAEAAAEQFTHRGAGGTEAAGNSLADYVNVLRSMVGGSV